MLHEYCFTVLDIVVIGIIYVIISIIVNMAVVPYLKELFKTK